jgi:O-antigen ligase
MVALRWTDEDGPAGTLRYAHDEYVQVAAELGLVGAALVAAALVALGRLLWRSRSDPGVTDARWAGVVAAACAFAVHSAFDFIWHIPAVPLLMITLIGLATVLPTTTATPGGASSAPEESHHSTIPTRKGTR